MSGRCEWGGGPGRAHFVECDAYASRPLSFWNFTAKFLLSKERRGGEACSMNFRRVAGDGVCVGKICVTLTR
jgi:hypothetical protein